VAETPIPSSALPPLYVAVGELVVNWAIVESTIVKTIAAIYQRAGGKRAHPRIPVAFKRQRKFLRLCFRSIAGLAPFAEEGCAILDGAANLTFIRNAVVHGAVCGFEPNTGRYTFLRLDVVDGGTVHEANTVTTTLLDLRGAVVDTQALTRRASALLDGTWMRSCASRASTISTAFSESVCRPQHQPTDEERLLFFHASRLVPWR
jgi:hypothetical protein